MKKRTWFYSSQYRVMLISYHVCIYIIWPTLDRNFVNYPRFKKEWWAYKSTVLTMTWWETIW
jgi:hypothetical protein